MSGIFLSHSTHDKAFVERLALDLTQRGFSVWFDSWHLEVGAHLTSTLWRGIHNSDYLLLVLSPHTDSSQWVKDELGWALARERLQGRNILLPVRIGAGKIPEQVTDRLYADFSGSYLLALESLVRKLKEWKVLAGAPFDLSRVDIPFFVEKMILDGDRLYSCLKSHLPLGRFITAGEELTARQMHLAPEEKYVIERRSAFERAELLDSDSGLGVDIRARLRAIAQNALLREQHLLEGLAKLCTVGLPLGTMGFSATWACQYFLVLQRWRLSNSFSFLVPGRSDDAIRTALSRGLLEPMRDADSATAVHGLTMLAVTVVPAGREYWQRYHIYIPADCPEAHSLRREGRLVLDEPHDHMVLISKYLAPQMLDVINFVHPGDAFESAIAEFPTTFERCSIAL